MTWTVDGVAREGLQVIPAYRLDHTADLRSSYAPLLSTAVRLFPAILVALPFLLAGAMVLSLPGYLAVNAGLGISSSVFATAGGQAGPAITRVAPPTTLEELTAMSDEDFDALAAQGGSPEGGRALALFLTPHHLRSVPMRPYAISPAEAGNGPVLTDNDEEAGRRQGAITAMRTNLERQQTSLEQANAALKRLKDAEADPSGEALKSLRADASNPFRSNTVATLQMLVDARQQDVGRTQQELDAALRIDKRMVGLKDIASSTDGGGSSLVWLVLGLADAVLVALAFGLLLPVLVHGGMSLYERDRMRTAGTMIGRFWQDESALNMRQPLLGLLCIGAASYLLTSTVPAFRILAALPNLQQAPAGPLEEQEQPVVDELKAAEEGMLQAPSVDSEKRVCRVDEARMLDGPEGMPTATVLRKGDMVLVQGSTPDGRFFKGAVATEHGTGMVGWWTSADFGVTD